MSWGHNLRIGNQTTMPSPSHSIRTIQSAPPRHRKRVTFRHRPPLSKSLVPPVASLFLPRIFIGWRKNPQPLFLHKDNRSNFTRPTFRKLCRCYTQAISIFPFPPSLGGVHRDRFVLGDHVNPSCWHFGGWPLRRRCRCKDSRSLLPEEFCNSVDACGFLFARG